MGTRKLKRGPAGMTATQHLFEAIERVRADVAKVEFWANAVEQFAQPVPDYDMDKAEGWIPSEMGTTLKHSDR